jgi:hypothetical protein
MVKHFKNVHYNLSLISKIKPALTSRVFLLYHGQLPSISSHATHTSVDTDISLLVPISDPILKPLTQPAEEYLFNYKNITYIRQNKI